VDGNRSIVHVSAPKGSYAGAVADRTWTVRSTDAHQPTSVMLSGARVAAGSWPLDAETRVLTVTTPTRPVRLPMEVAYR